MTVSKAKGCFQLQLLSAATTLISYNSYQQLPLLSAAAATTLHSYNSYQQLPNVSIVCNAVLKPCLIKRRMPLLAKRTLLMARSTFSYY